jgi:hypothetical protein
MAIIVANMGVYALTPQLNNTGLIGPIPIAIPIQDIQSTQQFQYNSNQFDSNPLIIKSTITVGEMAAVQ